MANFEDPSLVKAIEAASGYDRTTDGKSSEGVGNRLAVLHDVFFDSDPTWFQPFAVMLVLSAGVAALGLSQNSAATVIGAMIIAPLGSPIVSLGGALALGWPREALRMLLSNQAHSLTVANRTASAAAGPQTVVSGVQTNGAEIVVDIAHAGEGFDPDQFAQTLRNALGPNIKVTVNKP